MSTENLKWWQRLRMKFSIWAIPVYVLPRASLQFLYGYLSNARGPSFEDLTRYHIIRWFSRILDFQELRIINGDAKPISSALGNVSSLLEAGVECTKVQSPSVRGFWLPRAPNSEYIIFYIRGGGFASGSCSTYAKYLLQMFLELRERGIKCDILSVGYDLSPEVQYPTAIAQLSNAYQYALEFGKPIIMMGDSAGGNLCLALLRHLRIPHPEIKPIVTPRSPLAVVLVSPWVNLKNDGKSMVANAPYDCLEGPTLMRWTRAYLGPAMSLDPYSSPSETEKGWKEILPPHSLIIAGELELFLSDILDLARKIKEDGYNCLDLQIEPLKGHAWPAVDFAFSITDQVNLELKDDTGMHAALKGIKAQADWIERLLCHQLKPLDK